MNRSAKKRTTPGEGARPSARDSGGSGWHRTCSFCRPCSEVFPSPARSPRCSQPGPHPRAGRTPSRSPRPPPRRSSSCPFSRRHQRVPLGLAASIGGEARGVLRAKDRPSRCGTIVFGLVYGITLMAAIISWNGVDGPCSVCHSQALLWSIPVAGPWAANFSAPPDERVPTLFVAAWSGLEAASLAMIIVGAIGHDVTLNIPSATCGQGERGPADDAASRNALAADFVVTVGRGRPLRRRWGWMPLSTASRRVNLPTDVAVVRFAHPGQDRSPKSRSSLYGDRTESGRQSAEHDSKRRERGAPERRRHATRVGPSAARTDQEQRGARDDRPDDRGHRPGAQHTAHHPPRISVADGGPRRPRGELGVTRRDSVPRSATA